MKFELLLGVDMKKKPNIIFFSYMRFCLRLKHMQRMFCERKYIWLLLLNTAS